eukprot:SAG11_NODE_1222_length_5484_cov_7.843268_4_plen_49_part_00
MKDMIDVHTVSFKTHTFPHPKQYLQNLHCYATMRFPHLLRAQFGCINN